MTRIPMNGHAQPRIDALDLSTRKSKVIEVGLRSLISPDGQRIVFSTTRDKVNEVVTKAAARRPSSCISMDADGSNPRLLLGKVQPWFRRARLVRRRLANTPDQQQGFGHDNLRR